MIETTENGDSFDWRIPVIPVDPVNTDSVCVWDYDSPFGLMIAYLMKSSERDVFKYWKGGGGEFYYVRQIRVRHSRGFCINFGFQL